MENSMATTVIAGDTWRFSFLTSRLVRLEYQENGCFEDRGTTFARNRAFPAVEVIRREHAGRLELDTEYLHVVYDRETFQPERTFHSDQGKSPRPGRTLALR